MKFGRRRFVQAMIAVGALLGLWQVLPVLGLRSAMGAGQRRTFLAYLDTLIPADAHGPSATGLGVHLPIIADADAHRGYMSRILWGCGWLDREARKLGAANFIDLDGDGRDKVIALAHGQEENSRLRGFYQKTRRDAFSYYYANPETWAAAGYHGPPQPEGFMDFAGPPGRGA